MHARFSWKIWIYKKSFSVIYVFLTFLHYSIVINTVLVSDLFDFKKINLQHFT